MDDILSHIDHYEHINGICILLKPNSARLTVTFRYCIQELLTHLHKSAANNIVFCFTNARATMYKPGETLPVLRKMLAEMNSNRGTDLEATDSNCFCFDNEAFRFLAACNQGVNFTDDDLK